MRNYKKLLIESDYKVYLELYLNNLKRMNKSEHTIKNYSADLSKFFHWLDQTKKISLNKVNGEVIGEYKEFLMKGGAVYYSRSIYHKNTAILAMMSMIFMKAFFKKTPKRHILFFQAPMSVSSRRRHLSSIKNFYEYLKESHEDTNNKFSKNPVKNKIHSITLKDVDVVNTKLITKTEFETVYENSYRTKNRLMLELLYFGGMRLSEICHLKKTDFDLETKSITFIRKGGSRHQLYINEAELIFNNFLFYINNDPVESNYLFHNSAGKSYSLKAIYNQIMSLLKNNNIRSEITPHSFRKACATNLYRETKDLLLVRDYLNHSDAKVTQTYINTKSYMFQ